MRARGFTLLELLIALSVFAVMAAMAYGGLSSVIEARTQVDQTLERTQRLQLAVYRIQTDLEQAVARSVRDGFGDFRPALAGNPDTGIIFTHLGWRNPLGETRSHMQRVRYGLDAENRLVRAHWRVLDRAQDSPIVETVLAADLERLEWRYLDRNREWHDQWPPLEAQTGSPASATAQEASERLPLAVELRLTTADRGETRHLIVIPGGEG